MNNKKFSLADIEKLCREYDLLWGSYPEHMYEGASFYRFLLKKSADPGDEVKEFTNNEWAASITDLTNLPDSPPA